MCDDGDLRRRLLCFDAIGVFFPWFDNGAVSTHAFIGGGGESQILLTYFFFHKKERFF